MEMINIILWIVILNFVMNFVFFIVLLGVSDMPKLDDPGSLVKKSQCPDVIKSDCIEPDTIPKI